MRSRLFAGLAALLCLGSGATAGERPISWPSASWRHGHEGPRGYPAGYGYGGYGFAGAAVSGDYIGAPLTRFPRPSAIVPPVWGYGTYGVPTMTGIRQAPVGDPKIYVVRGVGPSARRTHPGAWPDADAGTAAGGPHVVSVTVPRR